MTMTSHSEFEIKIIFWICIIAILFFTPCLLDRAGLLTTYLPILKRRAAVIVLIVLSYAGFVGVLIYGVKNRDTE